MSEAMTVAGAIALMAAGGVFTLCVAVAFIDNTCARGAPWRFERT